MAEDPVKLRKTINWVLAVHKKVPSRDGLSWCQECHQPYPCPTRNILEGKRP